MNTLAYNAAAIITAVKSLIVEERGLKQMNAYTLFLIHPEKKVGRVN
jgi:hypothetical protein